MQNIHSIKYSFAWARYIHKATTKMASINMNETVLAPSLKSRYSIEVVRKLTQRSCVKTCWCQNKHILCHFLSFVMKFPEPHVFFLLKCHSKHFLRFLLHTKTHEWRIKNCGNNEKCTYLKDLNRVLQEASSTDLEPVGEEIGWYSSSRLDHIVKMPMR